MLKRINWEITYRCNLGCGFCFLKSARKLNAPGKELNFEQVKSFIDSAAGPKIDFYITGGEPFARPDCLDILELVKARGGHCGVNTNGTLLDERKIRRLAAIGLDYVIFSLHGPPRIHDALCGKSGAFARATRNLRLLSSLARPGTEIMVSCTLNEKNYRSMDGFFRLCRELGARRVLFEHLQFLSRAEAKAHAGAWKTFSPEPCRIITPCCSTRQKIDVRELARQIEALARLGYQGTHFDIRPRLSPAGLEQWYRGSVPIQGSCRSVRDVMVVAPNGDARICQLFDKSLGKDAAAGWKKRWLDKDAKLFRKKTSKGIFPGCARCCQRFDIFRYY